MLKKLKLLLLTPQRRLAEQLEPKKLQLPECWIVLAMPLDYFIDVIQLRVDITRKGLICYTRTGLLI